MQWTREQYIELMTFGRAERPMFSELFGPLVGLAQEWRAQGAFDDEIDMVGFELDDVPYVDCGGGAVCSTRRRCNSSRIPTSTASSGTTWDASPCSARAPRPCRCRRSSRSRSKTSVRRCTCRPCYSSRCWQTQQNAARMLRKRQWSWGGRVPEHLHAQSRHRLRRPPARSVGVPGHRNRPKTGVAVTAHDQMLLQINHEGSLDERGWLQVPGRIQFQFMGDPLSAAAEAGRFRMQHDLAARSSAFMRIASGRTCRTAGVSTASGRRGWA